MRHFVTWLLFLTAIAPCVAQSAPADYQVATVMAVEPRAPDSKITPGVTQYDITLKVGSTMYVVLFTDSTGGSAIKQRPGIDVLVHIENDTVSYSDLLGREKTLPIVSRKELIGESPH